ncbi:MAG: TatD family hydrolase [bacterium]|nr:TatD family hydrolase [bacterium]
MLIDTHAHLNFPDYQDDLDTVVSQAKAVGVGKIICASSNLADSKKAVEIAERYPEAVFAAVGIHPQQTDPENPLSLKDQLKILTKLAKKPGVVAIGECGLDFSFASPEQSKARPAPPGEKDRTPKEQYSLFEAQIKLARELNLPLIVHSRKSFAETVAFLGEKRATRGVLHCYSGGKSGIGKILGLGFYFGLDGNLTYDEGLQNVAKVISLEKIILETDSPLLSPLPFRGERNEPTNIKIIAECLAKIKSVSFEEICRITTQNAESLFPLRV